MQPLRSSFFAHGSEYYELSDEYSQSEDSFSGDFEYFGYVNNIGKWIIQRHQISTGAWRYVNGVNSYSTAWGINSSLSYDYYYTLSNSAP